MNELQQPLTYHQTFKTSLLMQKGDKFIVVRKGHELDGKVVVFISNESSYGCFQYKGKLIALPFHSIKPLARFPCDDEQTNID